MFETLLSGAQGTLGTVGTLTGAANGAASIISGTVGTLTGTVSGIGSTLSGIGTSALSAVGSVLSSVGLGSAFSGTVGQVLSDGFSCWGSSMPPSETKKTIKTYHAPFLAAIDRDINNSVNNLPALQNALNNGLKSIYIAHAHYKRLPSTGFDSCSRSGIGLMFKVYDSAKTAVDQLVEKFVSMGAVKSNFSVSPVTLNIPKSMTGASKDFLIGKNNPKTFSVEIPQIVFPNAFGSSLSTEKTIDGGSLKNVNVNGKEPDNTLLYVIGGFILAKILKIF